MSENQLRIATRKSPLAMWQAEHVAERLLAAHPDLQVELVDRFGLIPSATRSLFRLAALRLRAVALGIRRMDVNSGGARVEFGASTQVDPTTVVGLIQSAPHRYRFDSQQRLRVIDEFDTPEERFSCAEQLLDELEAGPPALEQSLSGGRA